MLTGRLLAQLGWVFATEAERIRVPDPKRWLEYGIRADLTEEQIAEAERLDAVADSLFDRAKQDGVIENGTDFVFGGES